MASIELWMPTETLPSPRRGVAGGGPAFGLPAGNSQPHDLKWYALRGCVVFFFVGLLAYLLDSSGTVSTTTSHRSEYVIPAVKAGERTGAIQAALDAAVSANAAVPFPASVDQVVSGAWNWTAVDPWVRAQRGNVSLQFVETPMGAAAHGGDAEFELAGHQSGKVSMQLHTVEEPLRGLHMVQGSLRVQRGGSRSGKEWLGSVEGAYIPAIGELFLASVGSHVTVGLAVHTADVTSPSLVEAAKQHAAATAASALAKAASRQRKRGLVLRHAVTRDATSGHRDGVAVDGGLLDDEGNAHVRRTAGLMDAAAKAVADEVGTGCHLTARFTFEPVSSATAVASPFSFLSSPHAVASWSQPRQHRRSLHALRAGSASPGETGRRLALSPAGAHVARATGSISSPNCDFHATASLHGLAYDDVRLTGQMQHLAYTSLLVTLVQVLAVTYQMRATSSPFVARRVSLLSAVAMPALVEAFVAVLCLIAGLVWRPWLAAFGVVAIAKAVLVCGMYLALALMHRRAVDETLYDSLTASQRLQLLLPNIARFLLALAFAFALCFVFWDGVTLAVFAVYSVWVPQIVLSARNNVKPGVNAVFVTTTSLSLLFMVLYLWACPYNLFQSLAPYASPAWRPIVFVLWMALQVATLAGQARVHPLFFLPSHMRPAKYNYYRPVSSPVDAPPLQQRAPALDPKDSGSEDSDGDSVSSPYTCAICACSVDVTANEHMVTPCDHVFHTECLMQWMKIKLSCPMCRTELPQL